MCSGEYEINRKSNPRGQASMSAATQNLALDLLQNALSSRLAYAVLGSVQSLTHEGARTMWRDGQHCAHAPSTSMRGVVEPHTLPECLMFVSPAVVLARKLPCEILVNSAKTVFYLGCGISWDFLADSESSPLKVRCLRSNIILQQMDYSQRQDTQVAVEEAVAYPTSIRNANAELLKRVDMRTAIQRTSHWSPLHEEVHISLSDVVCWKCWKLVVMTSSRGFAMAQVLFLITSTDEPLAMFDTPKDRHVFPWLEVNTRFGVIERKDLTSS